MPYKVPNVLSYSPFGHGGLTRAVANLFGGGPSGEEQAKLQAELDAKRAMSEYYLSQRDVNNAKIAEAERSRVAMEDAPRQVVRAIFGNHPQADLWMKSRETGSMPVAEFTTPVGSQLGPSQAQADVIPAQFDPNMVANATRMLTAIAAAKALPGNDNLKHLGDLVGRLYALGTEDDIRGGKLDATTAAGAGYAAGRHTNEPFKQGKFGMGNVVTGGLADPSLFNAEVRTEGEKAKTEGTKQQENRAQAGAASAQAGLRNEELRRLKEDGLVPVLDPTTRTPMLGPDNKPIMIRASEQGKILQRGEDKRATQDNGAALKPPGAEKAPIKVDPKLLRSELGRLVEEGDERMLDPAFANSVVSRAMALAQEQGGEFWGKPVEAVRVALTEATGGKEVVDITGNWRDKNKRFAAPGFDPKQAPKSSTSAPNLPAPTRLMPPGAAAAPGGIPAPKTKAEYDALPPGATYIGTDGQQKVKRGGDASGAVGT